MIDRQARNILAESTRHYLGGLLSNFEFDEKLFDIASDDAAIPAIRDQLWLLYDDLRKHKHEDYWRLSEETLKILARAIMFLKSDFEYAWPKIPMWYKTLRPIVWLSSFGGGAKFLDRKYYLIDEMGVWPFVSQLQIEQARCEPTYLAGAT